jgi:cobalt-zinc-cadmium efflux system membrane fusion protein
MAAASACSHPDAAPAASPAATAAPSRDPDEVRIPEASKQYVAVEEVAATRSPSVLSVPARVDFRDGAVSEVGPPVDGRVASVDVLVGQRVRPGDPLLTLDSPEAADLRAAADVAEVSLRDAKLELERQQRMEQEGVGVARDLIAAQTRELSAETEVARAQAGAESIGKGGAAAVVVRAPIAGVVIQRKATVGMAVQRGGEALVEIADPSALWIVGDVFDRDVAGVRAGAKATATFSAVDRPLDGRVTAVGTIVTPDLRTAPVYVSVDSRGAPLKPGMFGRLEIETADAGITLPTTAVLIKDGKDPVVFVQKDPLTFVRRRIVVGQPVGDRVPVISGLTPGDKVVVRGGLLLDGSADQLL